MFAIIDGSGYGVVIALVAFFYALLTTKEATQSIWVSLAGFVPTLLIVWFFEYEVNVSHTGYLGGYGYAVFACCIGLIAAGIALVSRSAGGLLIGGGVSIMLLSAIGYGVTYWTTSVGTEANRNYAALGNITRAKAGDKPVLPDTDVNEMVAMDVHLAYTRAHSVLGSGGNNLGSYYEIEESEGVQQWVAGKNWFVFPLELNGVMEQEGWFTHQISCGAGFVAVPADEPNADVKIVNNLCLNYLPGSSFSKNLQRYVYTHGYSDGQLVDPTMESDDNWHPYFTITYVQPAYTVGGDKVVKVLVVDPANGDIQAYDPDKTPEWVDRVSSEGMVNGWAGDFAKYINNPAFFNSNNAGQMKVDTVRLVNIHGQHQVWQIPLLANNDKAISTNGIILYDTRETKGTFYEAEGASGLASNSTLVAAFENIKENTRGWTVDHVQFYSVQGVPTWMAIYAKTTTAGSQFAGVGFLDARDTNSASVKFATSKQEALDAYKDFLSQKNLSDENVDEKVVSIKLSGVVLRVGPELLANAQTVYKVLIKGDARVFSVSHNLSDVLPDVKEGDSISITFDEPLSPHVRVRSVTTFDDTTLADQMKAPAKQ
jgi:hypothetical protein